jgi:hypothetical protein
MSGPSYTTFPVAVTIQSIEGLYICRRANKFLKSRVRPGGQPEKELADSSSYHATGVRVRELPIRIEDLLTSKVMV